MAAVLMAALWPAQAVPLRSDCGLPRPNAIQRAGDTTIFTLAHGDKGRCDGDSRPRGSAPYSERAELRSDVIARGARHRAEFALRFAPDGRSARGTSFFQVHSWNRGCTGCKPPIMLRIGGDGMVSAFLLDANGQTHRAVGLGVSRSQLAAGWRRFTVDFTTHPGSGNTLDISMDGRRLLTSARYHFPARGTPYYKLGLYRPGNPEGTPRDQVSFRSFVATRN
ncbi:heparin lyase I family protein [Aquibium carbonis]|uniref:heparin lyase I family protein n=1 Tax=Aquibium carbonis TaxID=2495581 RepID=UPI001478BF7D|nr:heparin lyase I family protein [Aquibium carbonis]